MEGNAAILKQEGFSGALEKNVGMRVSGPEFLLHLTDERVFFVFGFPVATRQIEGVEKSSIDADRALTSPSQLVLWDDGPVVLTCAFF
jgi:hypothetical protein